MIKSKLKFLTSIKEELFKIVYPKKNETIKAFFIVVILSISLGVGIWLLDGKSLLVSECKWSAKVNRGDFVFFLV